MVKDKVSSTRTVNNKPHKKIQRRKSAKQVWFYSLVQHPGYIAIHRAWYTAKTKKLIRVDKEEQPVKDTSVAHLAETLAYFVGALSRPVIDYSTFKKRCFLF